jgi:hypothetical protein
MAADLVELPAKEMMEVVEDPVPIKVVVVAVAPVLLAGMDKVLHQIMQDLVALVTPGLTVLLVLAEAVVVDIR